MGSHQSLHGEPASDGTQLVALVNDGDTNVVQEARELLKEYGYYMYEELGLIAGKESFFRELTNFPGPNYLMPSGIFIVARAGDMAAGCVGIKKFDEESCEMKRMYIRPAYRGRGMGRLLCNYVIDWCRKSMYRRILLDTNAEMKEAVFLYRKCGFIEIAPYCLNENDHPVFMEYAL
jgi:GNAT superfamily N-acetyltransferase